MHFVYYDNLIFTGGGEKAEFFFQFPYLLDASVGCAVNFVEIKGAARSDFQAGGAGAARSIGFSCQAVNGLGHNAGKCGFPHTSDTGKEDGVGYPVKDKTVLQCFNNRALTDDLIKGLRAGFSGKNKIRHVTPWPEPGNVERGMI